MEGVSGWGLGILGEGGLEFSVDDREVVVRGVDVVLPSDVVFVADD